MTKHRFDQNTDKLSWEANIEYLAERVAATYGTEVATSVFARYDATCFDNLSPAYYETVFGDLMQIDADG